MSAAWVWLPHHARAQAPTDPADTLRRHTLPPITVSVTRADLPLQRIPHAIQVVDRAEISRARPTWGLDEALFTVPGVYVGNRYNFSLDQRVSIRGFGSRSAFAMRGVKVLLDGIPQTLPDGQGQLTNLELGLADRIEVLRGSSSALFGNASGGVISIWTDPSVPEGAALAQDVRVLAGSFDRDRDRTWTKWQSSTRFRVGPGSALVSVSRLDYEGERDHSAADLRGLNTRFQFPLGTGWSLNVTADVGDQPQADNPGALTLAELRANRDSAPAINLSSNAGKDVMQAQGGITLRREFATGGEAAATVFGLTRDLKNPTTFAYIDLDRRAYGARLTVTRPLPLGRLGHRLTAGFDVQRQRDDRLNLGNNGGVPDPSVRTLDQLEHVTELGPFLQSALEVSGRATVTAGLRYDRVSFDVADRLVTATNPDDSGERVMDALSGSLGVTVAASDQLTVYANAGSSFETPTTTELTNRPDMAGGFNADLGPQRAWNVEVGARGADGRLRWNGALFLVDVNNLLVSFEVPTSPQRRFFRNAGGARHVGFEFGGRLDLGAGVDVLASWTWSDFKYTDFQVNASGGRVFVLDGRELPGIPEHWVRALVRARPAFARGGWVELEQTASSGYLVDDTASVRVDGWNVTNVRAGWEGTVGSVRVSPFVGLNNAFNKHYVGSVVINGARGRYYEPAPGRNAYVGFSLGVAP